MKTLSVIVESNFKGDCFLFDGVLIPVLPPSPTHYPDLVKALVYKHGHSDAPKPQPIIQKRLTNGLDFDQAGDVIADASEELSFICTYRNQVWYVQNRDLLEYIQDNTDMNLQFLSDKFDHLKPPSLASEFDLD